MAIRLRIRLPGGRSRDARRRRTPLRVTVLGVVHRVRLRIPGFRPRPSDARLDRSWPSDARRSDHPHVRPTPDPETERRRRLRLAALAFFLSLVFVGSSLAAVFGESGFLDLRRRHREIRALEKEVERRKAELSTLEAYVKRLETDPTAIERIAREDLGLVKPGEITFLLPREEEAAGAGETPEQAPELAPDPPAAGPELP